MSPHKHVPHPHLKHHAVVHPAELLTTNKRLTGRLNDWTATHLAMVFGAVWTIWVFFIWPIAAQFMSPWVQGKTSYYAQSWVQLFALPLFVYVGNKLQRSSDAQSEAQHQALTHIANAGDAVHELTVQIHEHITGAGPEDREGGERA